MQDVARRVARTHTEMRTSLLKAFTGKEMGLQCGRHETSPTAQSYRLDDLFPVISRRIKVRRTAPITAITIVMMNP